MRRRSILCAGLVGLAAAALLRSPALMLAALAATVFALLIVTARRHLFTNLSFERTLSRHVVSWGSELEIAMSVTNDKLLPLVWMRVRDTWPAGLEPEGFTLKPVVHLGRQVFSQTVSVRWYERLRRRYRVRCLERGLHALGPVDLEAGDPFGIAGVERTLQAREELVVLPRVLEIPALEAAMGRPIAEEVVARSLAYDPTALRGTRAYRPGDPMRAINWRATARSAALHTNEFDPASVAAVRVLLDVGSLYKAWEGIDPELMELLCVVAASLAAAFAGRGYAVGLASNACLSRESRAADLQPAHGGLADVLETLARLRPYTIRDYGHVLSAELADETATADCVVIAATLRPAVRSMIARLRDERPTTVVFVGTPSRVEAPFADLVVPSDFDWRTSDALPLRA